MAVDPRSPVCPVSFLARSQSHSLHVSSPPPLPLSSSSSSLALFSSSGVAGVVVDPRSPVRPVSFLARSQSHGLHTSLLHTSVHLVFGLALLILLCISFAITLITTLWPLRALTTTRPHHYTLTTTQNRNIEQTNAKGCMQWSHVRIQCAIDSRKSPDDVI